MPNIADTLQKHITNANLVAGVDVSEENEEKYMAKVEQELVGLRAQVEDLENQVHFRKTKALPLSYDQRVHGLRAALDKVPEIAKSETYGKIVAIDELETTVDSLNQALVSIREEELNLQAVKAQEWKLNDELKEVEISLRSKVELLKSSNEEPAIMINALQEKAQLYKQNVKTLLVDLRDVLDNVVAKHLGDPDKVQIRKTVETLLNEMFESNNFVQVSPNDSMVQFLVSNDLVIVNPENPALVRLREFGKS